MKQLNYSIVFLILIQLTACIDSSKNNSQINWESWSFYKPKENPIIKADASKKFFDPAR